MIVVYILSVFYFGLIYWLWIGLFRLKKPKSCLEAEQSQQNISVVVAARDEEEYIGELLDVLVSQNYPKENYEIVIADDRSEDRTSEIIQGFARKYGFLKYLAVQESDELVGKKNAIEQAVMRTKYSILAFTDADCVPTKNWLSELNRHYYDDVDFIAGYSPLLMPEFCESNTNHTWFKNFINKLKNFERISIFAVTAGSFGWNTGLTCTARNMSYRKELYGKVNGFAGIGHIRSGDDDLMLQKMSKYIRNMTFMFTSDSTVVSYDNTDFKAQINQETRRASKWKYYPLHLKYMTAFTALFYLSFIFIIIQGILGMIPFILFIFLVGLKVIPEFLLIFTFLIKIKKKVFIIFFPIAELLYLPYFFLFAVKGLLGRYKWKN